MNIYQKLINQKEKLAVIGLGYVGLPLAIAFSKKVQVIGFDVNEEKIKTYKNGIDITGDLETGALEKTTVEFTSEEDKLDEANFYIIAVPTPVNGNKLPDLHFVEQASRLVGRHLKRDSVVVYESTVYPGVTEEICIPILEEVSGLKCGIDFKVGYSPERINPGDKIHKLDNIIKIVSGIDDETLKIVANVYEIIVDAGVHRAETIKVAEAAKVIENAQRDINIAFMNELSMIFAKMEIDTQAVLRAAGTKWNFLNFKPGLVGGHCIGIDPYYLTYKAEGSGYYSKIILAGRQVNDSMGKYIAEQIIKILVREKMNLHSTKIGIIGFTYKENCSDIRNTKVIDIIDELKEYGITTIVVDPNADADEVYREYDIELSDDRALQDLNVVVVAVPHEQYTNMTVEDFDKLFAKQEKRIFLDIKGTYNRKQFENEGYYYWSL